MTALQMEHHENNIIFISIVVVITTVIAVVVTEGCGWCHGEVAEGEIDRCRRRTQANPSGPPLQRRERLRGGGTGRGGG